MPETFSSPYRVRTLAIWFITLLHVNAFAEHDWQWLNQLIDSKNITTIENLLAELPSSMREDYLLMYKSRSLQKAAHGLGANRYI